MVKIYRISVLMFAILLTGCRSEAMSQSDFSSAVETQNTISNIQLKYLAGIRKKANEERLRECMKTVGLDPANDKPVGKYSLGMRQRLGIAQVLMEDPDFILLDEPMNGLDNEGVVQMRELFIKLKQQGKTFLVVSHNRDDIEALCDEVYEMDTGMLKKLKK